MASTLKPSQSKKPARPHTTFVACDFTAAPGGLDRYFDAITMFNVLYALSDQPAGPASSANTDQTAIATITAPAPHRSQSRALSLDNNPRAPWAPNA